MNPQALIITFIRILHLLLQAYGYVIIADAVLSWFRLDPRHPLVRLLDRLTEPLLSPIRRLVPETAGLDLSPAVALLLIMLMDRLLISSARLF